MDRLEVMRLFVRIAETGSFSKAARAAGIGQPTASKQIAELEERLGGSVGATYVPRIEHHRRGTKLL